MTKQFNLIKSIGEDLKGGVIAYGISSLYKMVKERQKPITLINEDKLLKECPVGFSWIVFFFAGFVALFRGDLKWFIILSICGLSVIGIIPLFYFSANYNKIYIRELLEKGYKPYDKKASDALKQMGIYYGK